MTTIYTIGHSRHPSEHLVALLSAHEIAVLVDVRSHPASKWAPQFGKAALAQTLANHAIEYVFLARELGGRPDGAEFYREDGSVDYDRRAQAPDIKAGIERLVAVARERSTAIMCAEEDPARCHRRLLVTPALKRGGKPSKGNAHGVDASAVRVVGVSDIEKRRARRLQGAGGCRVKPQPLAARRSTRNPSPGGNERRSAQSSIPDYLLTLE